MSKISEANRVAKGNVKNLRQSRLNQARSKLGIIPKPTSPAPSAPPRRSKKPKKKMTAYDTWKAQQAEKKL
jgi:hypothetical protein